MIKLIFQKKQISSVCTSNNVRVFLCAIIVSHFLLSEEDWAQEDLFLRFGQLLHEHTKSTGLAPISQVVLMFEFVGRSKTTEVSHTQSASTANSVGRKRGTSQDFEVETRVVFHKEEHFVPRLRR